MPAELTKQDIRRFYRELEDPNYLPSFPRPKIRIPPKEWRQPDSWDPHQSYYGYPGR